MARALATEKNGRTNSVRPKRPITFLANISCSFLTLVCGRGANFFGPYRCSPRAKELPMYIDMRHIILAIYTKLITPHLGAQVPAEFARGRHVYHEVMYWPLFRYKQI